MFMCAQASAQESFIGKTFSACPAESSFTDMTFGVCEDVVFVLLETCALAKT